MAYHRLHRADGTALGAGPVLFQEGGEGQGLCTIADHGTCSMCFKQTNSERGHASLGIRAPQGELLAFGTRGGQSHGAAIAGASNGLNHGVDAVAIPLRVGQPFEHQHNDPFADDDAVCCSIKGARFSRRRQCLRLAEAHVAKGTLHRVNAAGNDHVSAVHLQFPDGQAHGRQRRRTSGVHHIVHTPQVEAIADPPRCHIQQDAGKGILRPLWEDAVALCNELGCGFTEQERQARAEYVGGAQVAQTAARPQNYRYPTAIQRPAQVASVFQRILRRLEGEQLHWIDRGQRVRWHAELHRVKGHIIDEPAPFRVGAVLGPAIGVVV